MYPLPPDEGLQGTGNEPGVDFGGSGRRKKGGGGGRFRAISFQSDLCAIPSRKASLFSQHPLFPYPPSARDFFLYPRARRWLPRRKKKEARRKRA